LLQGLRDGVKIVPKLCVRGAARLCSGEIFVPECLIKTINNVRLLSQVLPPPMLAPLNSRLSPRREETTVFLAMPESEPLKHSLLTGLHRQLRLRYTTEYSE